MFETQFNFLPSSHRSLTPELIVINMDNSNNEDLYATPELQIRRSEQWTNEVSIVTLLKFFRFHNINFSSDHDHIFSQATAVWQSDRWLFGMKLAVSDTLSTHSKTHHRRLRPKKGRQHPRPQRLRKLPCPRLRTRSPPLGRRKHWRLRTGFQQSQILRTTRQLRRTAIKTTVKPPHSMRKSNNVQRPTGYVCALWPPVWFMVTDNSTFWH